MIIRPYEGWEIIKCLHYNTTTRTNFNCTKRCHFVKCLYKKFVKVEMKKKKTDYGKKMEFPKKLKYWGIEKVPERSSSSWFKIIIKNNKRNYTKYKRQILSLCHIVTYL